MTTKPKLELTWIGKENRPRLEPRILIEEEGASYHASKKKDGDLFDNILIEGDNLLALRALEQDFGGKIKCVFIDPPYNTGSAFTHYDDGLEHSIWLSMMRDRLEILRNLLTEDGSLWATLDDNEAHYFKVLADEVFGRSNFVGNVIWEKADSPRMDARYFSVRHDHVLVYAKSKDSFRMNRPSNSEVPDHYNKTDETGRRYYLKPLRVMGGNISESLYFPMIDPDGSEVYPLEQDGSKGCWRWSKKKTIEEADRIEWVRGRQGWTPYFRIYHDSAADRPIETIWPHAEVGSNRTSKAEIKKLFSKDMFDTPKPERLLRKIISVATDEGDWVLDSFAGSGTTGAVAHKMSRRWIMVELGQHCRTHVAPRLQKVIGGDDMGGVTKEVGWEGGGGFRYYRLAPSMLEKDQFGNWVISKSYNAEMLSEAMCKHLGFAYAPSDEHYWMHGHSSETDFIYVTTASLTHEQLRAISQEVGDERTLLIACKAFQTPNPDGFPNLTLRKIPAAVLNRCEWGKDDYSLKIENLPMMDDGEDEEEDESDLFTGVAAK